ncbi:MAG: hypothetical protein NC389_16940 [Acetatifactor muris]|nr:hypothetical protein [Acetatifactor muris]
MAANVTDKLTPEGKRFLEAIKQISNLEVRIGFQAGEADHDGVDLCEIAAFNELGTVHIPSRPFLRDSVDGHLDEIGDHLVAWCRKIAHGEMEAHEMMMNIGMMQKGLIQEEIARGNFVPNAPATIRKKGSDTPLVDTGLMRDSVNYQIVPRGSYND